MRRAASISQPHYFDDEFGAHRKNLRRCSLVSFDRRSPETQAASGESAAPFGRRNETLEPNAVPLRFRIAQWSSWLPDRSVRKLDSPSAGGSTTISPCAVRSNRTPGLAMQRSKNSSSLRGFTSPDSQNARRSPTPRKGRCRESESPAPIPTAPPARPARWPADRPSYRLARGNTSPR